MNGSSSDGNSNSEKENLDRISQQLNELSYFNSNLIRYHDQIKQQIEQQHQQRIPLRRLNNTPTRPVPTPLQNEDVINNGMGTILEGKEDVSNENLSTNGMDALHNDIGLNLALYREENRLMTSPMEHSIIGEIDESVNDVSVNLSQNSMVTAMNNMFDMDYRVNGSNDYFVKDDTPHKIFDMDEQKHGNININSAETDSAQSPNIIRIQKQHQHNKAVLKGGHGSYGSGFTPHNVQNGNHLHAYGNGNKDEKKENGSINVIKMEKTENHVQRASLGCNNNNNLSCAPRDQYSILYSPFKFTVIVDKFKNKRSIIKNGIVHGITFETKRKGAVKSVSVPVVSCKLTMVDKINSWGAIHHSLLPNGKIAVIPAGLDRVISSPMDSIIEHYDERTYYEKINRFIPMEHSMGNQNTTHPLVDKYGDDLLNW